MTIMAMMAMMTIRAMMKIVAMKLMVALMTLMTIMTMKLMVAMMTMMTLIKMKAMKAVLYYRSWWDWSGMGPNVTIPNPDHPPLAIFLAHHCFCTKNKCNKFQH